MLTVSFDNLKRPKLQKVGSRSRFDVDRSFSLDNLGSAGITGVLTDIPVGQRFYKATLTVDKSPSYQNHSDNASMEDA